MQVSEMHYEFMLQRDEIDANDSKYFSPVEIDSYLNNAQWIILNNRYFPKKKGDKGFEFDQKRISDLSNLHIKSPELQPGIVPVQSSTEPGKYELKLNLLGKSGFLFRYLFLTKADVSITANGCTKICKLDIIRSNEYNTKFTEPNFYWGRVIGNFGRSSEIVTNNGFTQTDDIGGPSASSYINDRLQSLYLDTRNYAGTPQFTINMVYPSYLKYPNRIFVGGYDHIDGKSTAGSPPIHSDLDDSLHPEIVRLAVQLSRQSTQDQLGFQMNAPTLVQDNL